jgi:hypothetical protein
MMPIRRAQMDLMLSRPIIQQCASWASFGCHEVHLVWPILDCVMMLGGAGTWSDGKLTTRIGRNNSPVRMVLQTLCRFGAPSSILVNGKVQKIFRDQ